jgi:tyrosine-protein kinase Etk/Wzc
MISTRFVLKEGANAGNLKDNLMPYLKYWYWFAVGLLICLLGTYIYLAYTTPIYKITSTLLIPDDKKGDGILKATAFSDLNMFQQAKTADNEMEILRSRDLIYKALKVLNLEVSYFDNSGLRAKELYGKHLPFVVSVARLDAGAFQLQLGLEPYTANTFLLTEKNETWIYRYGQLINHDDYSFTVNKGTLLNKAGGKYVIKFNNLDNMAATYSAGRLQVNPVVKESNTIALTMNDAIPARGIDMLNNLISIYNAENVQKKNTMAVNTIAFIDNRLKVMTSDLSEVEGEVTAYKQQNSATDVGAGSQVNLMKSAEYNQLLEESSMQLDLVKAIEGYLSNPKNQFSVIPSTMGLKDPVLNTLVAHFNDLQLERNRMLNSADLSNPLVQDLSNQLTGLLVNIKENLKNIKVGFAIQRDNLRSNYSRYDNKIKSVPALEKGLLERNREQGVKTNLYQYLLQKREETALSLSATIPTAQLIDKPASSPVPEYPKSSLMYLLGGVLGLIVPGLFIYSGQKLNLKVKDTASLLNISGIRVLGELSHHEAKNPIAMYNGSTTIISELFRYIRSNLKLMDPGANNKIILVTSCMKGEGKTFFSINLGLTLAMQNKKVLIMEFDLRKPDLLQKLKIAQQKGISDFLQDDNSALLEYIQPYPGAENVDLLGCGSIPLNPAELLTSNRVKLLFNWLQDHYDYIIVDTSPVGAVADAFSLSTYADLSLYLIRYNYTSTEQLDILRDINDNKKLKNLMVVFNDAKKENRPVYAYGGYGYAADRSSK